MLTLAQRTVFKAIFTRNFLAVSAINMLGLIGYYAIFVVSSRYLTEVFGTSTATAGLAAGIIVIGCLVGRFFTGSIVHTAGYRRVLFAGALLYLLSSASYFFADSVGLVFLVRFISGVAVGIVGTATGTIIAVVVPPKYHGRGIAYFSLSTALALCFGPFFGIALVDPLGYEGIFIIGMAMSALVLFLVPFVRVASEAKRSNRRFSISNFIEPRLIPFGILVCVVCIAWGNMQAFMAPYARTFDVVAAASSFFLVYAVAIMVSRPFSGKIYDAHGAPVIIYPALVLLVGSLVLLWAVQEDWSVLLAGALAGLGFGNFQSIAQVSSISMVSSERYAQATSTFYIFFDLGIGMAPYISGYAVPYAGYDGVFGLNAIVVAAAIAGYAVLQASGRLARRPSRGKTIALKDGCE